MNTEKYGYYSCSYCKCECLYLRAVGPLVFPDYLHGKQLNAHRFLQNHTRYSDYLHSAHRFLQKHGRFLPCPDPAVIKVISQKHTICWECYKLHMEAQLFEQNTQCTLEEEEYDILYMTVEFEFKRTEGIP